MLNRLKQLIIRHQLNGTDQEIADALNTRIAPDDMMPNEVFYGPSLAQRVGLGRVTEADVRRAISEESDGHD